MKNNHFLLSLAFMAASISLFSCQKESDNPSSEEVIVYEKTYVATERGANTADIVWSANGAVDVRFEVEDVSTNLPIYGYGWINFTSGSHTANYSVTTGNTVRLRIKARKTTGSSATNVNYTFSSSCPVSFPTGGSLAPAPAGTAWTSIPGNARVTGACL